MISFRAASGSDVDRFYGERPSETLTAIAILLDGEPVAILGLANDIGCYRLFSDYKPELEPHLKSMTVLRALKAVQNLCAKAGLPVYALQERDPEILERLGFQRIRDGVYLWLH